jgi:hypothetical protein
MATTVIFTPVAGKAVGTTYTLAFTGTASHRYSLTLRLKNLLNQQIEVRVYVADNSWSADEPSGSTLVATLAKGVDGQIPAERTGLIEKIALTGTQKLIVRADAASAFDWVLSGVDEV